MLNGSASLHQYSFILPFEKNFSPNAAITWMSKQWHTGFAYSVLYIVVIFGLKHSMINSKPYSLQKILIFWNLMLSAFSIAALFRTFPEFYHSLTNYGFHYSICEPSNIVIDKVSSFWTFLFVLSKLPEFGDTLFIVLRKRRLIFLHWYHHVITLVYAWYSFKEITPYFRWIVVINCFIHSLMYSYYAIKVMRIRVPTILSMLLTSLQICQMIIGCCINLVIWYYKSINVSCNMSKSNLATCTLISISYLVLFVRFFYMAYFSPFSGRKKVKAV